MQSFFITCDQALFFSERKSMEAREGKKNAWCIYLTNRLPKVQNLDFNLIACETKEALGLLVETLTLDVENEFLSVLNSYFCDFISKTLKDEERENLLFDRRPSRSDQEELLFDNFPKRADCNYLKVLLWTNFCLAFSLQFHAKFYIQIPKEEQLILM